MYQAAWWGMEFQICQFAAVMVSAALRVDMLQSSLVFAFSQLASYVASALYVRWKLPGFSPWLKGAKRRIGVSDLGQSVFLTTSNLIQQGAVNGSVLLVSVLAGPIAGPVVSTVRTLTNLWSAVATFLSTPLLPHGVRIHAKCPVPKLRAIYHAVRVLCQ